jgi:hypothetical protein
MKRNMILALAFLGVALAATPALAQYEINWWTVDGGGATFSIGGGYRLGGTIGQPDAGVLAGGDYTLYGGFWAVASPAVCPGDSNCDGDIDFDDIDFFVAALGGEPAWNALHLALLGAPPTCPYENNDVNGDGAVDFDDIDPFVAVIGTPCP